MSEPNRWANATVLNDWGKPIKVVTLKHRYDTDHYDEGSWAVLENQAAGESFRVGYWTGFGRTGKDYWYITFEVDGKLWYCKDNFYCFLTKDDENGLVKCRVYEEGGKGKMEVICPQSSNCTVSLQTDEATPNTWAKATVQNNWGHAIQNIQLSHRYDDDHYDAGHWSTLAEGESGGTFDVGYWTGPLRTGKDYWRVSFEADDKVWSCKNDFYCFLTKADAGQTVACRVYLDGEEGKMEVVCPQSSNCTVSLSSRDRNPSTTSRPVYVIGHRCNDPGDPGLAISRGCNAIECDLQYDNGSRTIFVNHDLAAGTQLTGWLNNARSIAEKYPNQFALVIFDCKFAAGMDTSIASDVLVQARQLVRDELTDSTGPVNVVFSIASFDKRGAFSGIQGDLKANEGIAIDMSNDPAAVQAFFTEGNVSNGWYGDGIFVGGARHVYPYVKAGAELRDRDGVIKKVYVWTLAKEKSIAEYINDAAVDGVMVNVPGTIPIYQTVFGLEEALAVVDSSPKAHLAVRSDPAFQVYRPQPNDVE